MFKTTKKFFNKNQYKKMKDIITGVDFPWYLQHTIVNEKNKGVFFAHMFFNNNGINSAYYKDIVIPFIEKLKIKKILRSKINLYPKTNKQVVHGFHTDRTDKHNVVLFYFNENNGYTLFKNKKVKSEDNKAVIFDGSLEHSSTTCTDKDYRITLNINYEF
jgi:hypothetical protein